MANLTAAYGKPCQTDTFVTVRDFGFKIPFVKHAANALLRAAIDAYDLGYRVQWQAKMKELGWDIAADGDYGDRSEQVCRAFQREKHLHIDGVLGPKTWRMAWEAPIT